MDASMGPMALSTGTAPPALVVIRSRMKLPSSKSKVITRPLAAGRSDVVVTEIPFQRLQLRRRNLVIRAKVKAFLVARPLDRRDAYALSGVGARSTAHEPLDSWLQPNGNGRQVQAETRHRSKGDPLDCRRIPAEGDIDSVRLARVLQHRFVRCWQSYVAKHGKNGFRRETAGDAGGELEVHVHRVALVVGGDHRRSVQSIAAEELCILG